MDSLQYLKTQLEEAKDKKDEMLIYRAEKALEEFKICATSKTIDDLQRNLELKGFAPAITDEGMDKALEAAEASGDSAAITREIVRQARLKAKSRIEAAQAARIKKGVDDVTKISIWGSAASVAGVILGFFGIIISIIVSSNQSNRIMPLGIGGMGVSVIVAGVLGCVIQCSVKKSNKKQ